MARQPVDLSGRRFGMLVVESITDQRNSYGRLLYKCRCDCGGERLATAANLQRGEVTCCGCLYHSPRRDITGQRFGRLVAVKPTAIPDGARTSYNWVCRCDCGRTVEVNANSLTQGNTTSCGCAQRDAVKALYVDGTAPCKLTEAEHPRQNNSSGVTGVWFDASRQRWCAEIVFKRKKHYLGRYVKKEDAILARKKAEEDLFGAYLDGEDSGQKTD